MSKLTKKKKIIIVATTPLIAFLLFFAILCITTAGMYSSAFLNRVLTHWDSNINDYKIFPERIAEKSESPYIYPLDIDGSLENITFKYKSGSKSKTANLKTFIEQTSTTSFIIVKEDKIIYEQYGKGYSESSINTSFSMAKSVDSLLIGKAIEKGYIKSVKEPISVYIPEFEGKEIGKNTIEDLLLMRSDIEYNEDKFLWFGDDTLTYWHPQLRKLALRHTATSNKYKGNFHYNNYHPLLLGIILERATDKTVTSFFATEIWQKLGVEYDASWSLDSSKSGFEKMESGINFRPKDFLKLGSMILHNGYFNEQKIIDADWLDASLYAEFPINEQEYKNTFLEGKSIGYKYMWYSTPAVNFGFDIFAWGKSDQILYISPSENIVILRTGKTDGGVSDWVSAIKSIISEIH